MRDIRIAAALIDDGRHRLLLVRKAGSRWFMQPGGKIEGAESPRAALRRELIEEIGVDGVAEAAPHLGRFSSCAANEPDCRVDADLFHVRMACLPIIGAEIAEAVWIDLAQIETMPLAPLTRDHVLPLARSLAGAVS